MTSVVIPAYNEENNIGRCLESFIAQTFQEPFEIIVVNNASTDKTREVALRYSAQLHIRVIDELQKGRGAARARGFAEAMGEIILSTDSDCTVPKDWIEQTVLALRNSKSIAITGGFTVQDLGWY